CVSLIVDERVVACVRRIAPVVSRFGIRVEPSRYIRRPDDTARGQAACDSKVVISKAIISEDSVSIICSLRHHKGSQVPLVPQKKPRTLGGLAYEELDILYPVFIEVEYIAVLVVLNIYKHQIWIDVGVHSLSVDGHRVGEGDACRGGVGR